MIFTDQQTNGSFSIHNSVRRYVFYDDIHQGMNSGSGEIAYLTTDDPRLPLKYRSEQIVQFHTLITSLRHSIDSLRAEVVQLFVHEAF